MADNAHAFSGEKENRAENFGHTSDIERSENIRTAPTSETNTTQGSALPVQKETVEKWKKTLSFLTPLFACIIINVIAGLFYISLLLVVSSIVRDAFSEDGESVAKVQNTFRVFSALSAAACAPLMIKYGFRKVAVGGSVLLIFSCISSSLTSNADILAIPFGFMGGIALGLLRTTGIVATLDYLHERPALALFISILCFVIGQIIGLFVFLFEMSRYLGSSRRWPNAMRIFEVTAVVGLLAGSFLQKNSRTQQNVPKVFRHPPFYILLAIGITASIGLTIVVPSTLSLPSERNFQSYVGHPILSVFFITLLCQLLALIVLFILRKFKREELKKTALLSFGILILVIGLATMFHQLTFVNVWPLAAFGVVLGVTQAFSLTLMPLALVQTTGKSNYKLVLPLLESVMEAGGLIGGGSMARISEATSSVNGSLYFAGISLIISGAGAVVGWILFKRWPPLDDEPIAKPFLEGAENTYATDEDIPGMQEE